MSRNDVAPSLVGSRYRILARCIRGLLLVALLLCTASTVLAQDLSAPTELAVVTNPAAPVLTPEQMSEVKKLFGEWAKAEEDKKKKQEEEKKKKAEEEGHVVGSVLGLSPVWRHGVWFETPDGDFRYHIGATFQGDLALYSVNDQVMFGTKGTGPFDDAFNPRRGRFRAEGSMYEVVDFLFELEFFNGVEVTGARIDDARNRTFNSPGPTDFHMTLRKLPVIGNVRIGIQKEPFGLEHLNSYRYLEFMERSYLFDAFTPTAFNNGFTPGIMAFNTMFDEHGTWWLGVFKNDYDLFGFGLGDGDLVVTGRLTGLPIYDEDDGRTMVHIGVAASHRDPILNQYRSRVRSSVRNAPFPLLPLIADTGFYNTTGMNLFNVEHAMVLGPVTIQAEYTASFSENASQPPNVGNVGTYFAQGGYVEALCFLTGEHRSWDRKTATFGRVIPNEPFFWVPGRDSWICGKGAWEAGVRYTYLDLTNKGILGGVLNDVTVGLNWYLNPNAKIQWNYDVVHRGDNGGTSSGIIQALGMRMAVDF